MAGGIGSRFWPISTTNLPKQFHDMLGTGDTLIQKTFSRLNKIVPSENIFVLTNSMYKNLVMKQLPKISEKQLVLEPTMRNTAPCILVSALKIKKENPNAIMLVAPSDHWIEDEEAFVSDIQKSFNACEKDDILMTLGIRPSFPNTGYGYIQYEKSADSEISKVKRFTEKPDYDTAKSFLKEGNYVWNSGMFIWSIKSILNSFETSLPEMHALFNKGVACYNTEKENDFISENFPKSENISIDYGIMEKAENVFVLPASFDWNDLGTWGALYDKLDKDEDENAIVRAKTYLKNANGNMVFSAKEKLIVLEDLNDFIIVDKENVLLIFPKKKEQEIKELLNNVKNKFGEEYS